MSLIRDLLIAPKRDRNLRGIAPGIDTVIKNKKTSRRKTILILSATLFIIISGVTVSIYIDSYSVRKNHVYYTKNTGTQTPEKNNSLNTTDNNIPDSLPQPSSPEREETVKRNPENMVHADNNIRKIKKMSDKKLAPGITRKRPASEVNESNVPALQREHKVEKREEIKRVPLYYKARECEERKDYQCAVENYKNILLLKPDDHKILNQLGYLYLRMNMPDKAMEYLKEALNIKPEYVPAIVNLSIAYMKIGEDDSALQLLLDVLKTNPHDRDILYTTGLLYERMGKKDEALHYYRRLMALDDPRGRDGLIRLNKVQ